MLYRISVTERGLTGIANIFRSRLSRLDDLLGAGTVPLKCHLRFFHVDRAMNLERHFWSLLVGTWDLGIGIDYWVKLFCIERMYPSLRSSCTKNDLDATFIDCMYIFLCYFRLL